MRCGVLLVLLGSANALFNFDLDKLRHAAHQILVKGVQTSRFDTNRGFLQIVNGIDRHIHVEFKRSSVAQFPKTAAKLPETCGKYWFCRQLDFELCPGQELNTGEVASQPDFSWPTRNDEFYSLLLVNLFSPRHAGLGGVQPRDIDAKVNWVALNMHGTHDVSTSTNQEVWQRPKNPFFKPATFVYLLFVHTQKIANVNVIKANRYRHITGTHTDLYKYVRYLGLTGNHLAAFTFFFVKTSVYTVFKSEVHIQARFCERLLAGVAGANDAKLNMCDSKIDRFCTKWIIKAVADPTTIAPPMAVASSPSDLTAALIAGRLRAQLGQRKPLQALNGPLGLFEEHSTALSFGSGALLGGLIAGVALVIFAVFSRREPVAENQNLLSE